MSASQDMTERCPLCGESCSMIVVGGRRRYETATPRLFHDNAIGMDQLRTTIKRLQKRIDDLTCEPKSPPEQVTPRHVQL